MSVELPVADRHNGSPHSTISLARVAQSIVVAFLVSTAAAAAAA